MRLWHEQLIKYLPRQQLLGQHRECCALRGNGWEKPHATVNYIFNYSVTHLFAYHCLVMDEMKKRGYTVTEEWASPSYRGKNCEPIDLTNFDKDTLKKMEFLIKSGHIYEEHDERYMEECLENLRNKGIYIHF
ncbi:uncharacterized protein (TIGR02328 family) [Salirhabdus euzebyi]|uniref:Uncharacterized protein (TIGR02328 family) n=1 Tax=Salirhabdus euzebyi TaxID=394506 RepID=A0A841PXM8_9BACI|nr:TIGR02328 family protein [Salirhabdus euzebyi]MBB6452814.1 uncharacterized protein (TIGR02328 family) [Salirhabdus euzebyi]